MFERRWLRYLCACVVFATFSARTPAAEPSVAFSINAGDTLIGLSERVFVSPDAWREIAVLNRLNKPYLLVPGQVLQVPVRLLRWTAAASTLTSVSGEVRVDGRAGAALEALNEGQSIETGPQGSAVLELADKSIIKLAPSSLAEVVTSRRHAASGDGASSPSTGLFSGVLRVLRGSVEVFATKVLRAKPLEVNTPTAVVGVRGTQYRVGFDEAANRSTRTEVIEGQVRFDAGANASATAATNANGADVSGGYGAAVDAAGAAPTVVKLLAAPDLSAAPERFERPIVRFGVAAEVQPLRLQVAADAEFNKVVRDLRVEPGTEVRVVGLDDGQWHLRARRVDPLGIEGFDAVRPFVLKARPEPPAPSQPRRGAKQTVGAVEFAWAQNVEAGSHRLQIARDEAFKDVVLDRDAVPGTAVRVEMTAQGSYFWRLASIRPNGDQGPFGDPLSFELRATPEPPKGGLGGDGGLAFNWAGRSQDRQQVELARDAEFKDIVAKAELTTSEWVLSKPDRAGDYFFRYRSIEPDGFVSPYSSTLKITVPKDWSSLWLLFPLLFML